MPDSWTVCWKPGQPIPAENPTNNVRLGCIPLHCDANRLCVLVLMQNTKKAFAEAYRRAHDTVRKQPERPGGKGRQEDHQGEPIRLCQLSAYSSGYTGLREAYILYIFPGPRAVKSACSTYVKHSVWPTTDKSNLQFRAYSGLSRVALKTGPHTTSA